MVAALAGQRDLTRVAAVEVGAQRDEVPDRVGPLGDKRLDSLDVAETDAGDEGVVDVLRRAVLRRHDRSDTALRPGGRPSSSTVLVTSRTRSTRRRRRAVVNPAIPEPTTMTSAVVVQPGAGARKRRGG